MERVKAKPISVEMDDVKWFGIYWLDYCGSCGSKKPLMEEYNFCPYCGSEIDWEIEE